MHTSNTVAIQDEKRIADYLQATSSRNAAKARALHSPYKPDDVFFRTENHSPKRNDPFRDTLNPRLYGSEFFGPFHESTGTWETPVQI